MKQVRLTVIADVPDDMPDDDVIIDVGNILHEGFNGGWMLEVSLSEPCHCQEIVARLEKLLQE